MEPLYIGSARMVPGYTLLFDILKDDELVRIMQERELPSYFFKVLLMKSMRIYHFLISLLP